MIPPSDQKNVSRPPAFCAQPQPKMNVSPASSRPAFAGLFPIVRRFRLFVALLLGQTVLGAATYYCDAVNGNDANNGLTTSAAFRTIQAASNLTVAGDTVLIMNGTYLEPTSPALNGNQGVLWVRRSGAPGAYITYKNYPGHSPLLHATNWNVIKIEAASYVIIDGLEVMGNNANITLAQANAVYDHFQKNKRSGNIDWNYVATTNTNGIYTSKNKTTGQISHHIEVRNCYVHSCAGAGIVAEYSDYVTFENNVSHSNCWYTLYATSGMGFAFMTSLDSNLADYKLILRNNVVYDNECFVKWEATKAFSDGNGIILDSYLSYVGRTLVANNISYENGGTGIHGFRAPQATIINNTLYNNARSAALSWPQGGLNQCTDSTFSNNIVYGRAGKLVAPYSSTGYSFNLYYNAVETQGPNDLVGDPKFVNIATKDFHLQQGSPAMDTGTSTSAPATDIDGAARPAGYGYDRGAYEQAGNNPLPPPEIIIDNVDANCTFVGAWQVANSTPGYYGSNVAHDGSTNQNGWSATYTPTIPAARAHTVYARWTASSNRASNVPIDVNHAGGTTTFTVDQKLNGGVWVLLGTFQFNAGTSGNVKIRNDNASGYVIADAVRFVPN
jgi:hypothetical protein